MKIEKTEAWITCERPIEADVTAVRGFFGKADFLFCVCHLSSGSLIFNGPE
ncbi:MAG: hypothetical protein AB1499_11310 [Nitrospirota bacterium]